LVVKETEPNKSFYRYFNREGFLFVGHFIFGVALYLGGGIFLGGREERRSEKFEKSGK